MTLHKGWISDDELADDLSYIAAKGVSGPSLDLSRHISSGMVQKSTAKIAISGEIESVKLALALGNITKNKHYLWIIDVIEEYRAGKMSYAELKEKIKTEINMERAGTLFKIYFFSLLIDNAGPEYGIAIRSIFEDPNSFLSREVMFEELFFHANPYTRELTYKYMVRHIIGEDDPMVRFQYMLRYLIIEDEMSEEEKIKTLADMLLETLVVLEMKKGEITVEDIRLINSFALGLDATTAHPDPAQNNRGQKAMEIVRRKGMKIFGNKFIELLKEKKGDTKYAEHIEKYADPSMSPIKKIRSWCSKDVRVESIDSRELAAILEGIRNDAFVRMRVHRTIVMSERVTQMGIYLLREVWRHAGTGELVHIYMGELKIGEIACNRNIRNGYRRFFGEIVAGRVDALRGSMMEIIKLLKDRDDRKTIITTVATTAEEYIDYVYTIENMRQFPHMHEILVDAIIDNDPTLWPHAVEILKCLTRKHPHEARKNIEKLIPKLMKPEERNALLVKMKCEELMEGVDQKTRDLIRRLMKESEESQNGSLKTGQKAKERKTYCDFSIKMLEKLNDTLAGMLSDRPSRGDDNMAMQERMQTSMSKQMMAGEVYEKKSLDDIDSPATSILSSLRLERRRAGTGNAMEWAFSAPVSVNEQSKGATNTYLFHISGRIDSDGELHIAIMQQGFRTVIVTKDSLTGMSLNNFQELHYVILKVLGEFYSEQIVVSVPNSDSAVSEAGDTVPLGDAGEGEPPDVVNNGLPQDEPPKKAIPPRAITPSTHGDANIDLGTHEEPQPSTSGEGLQNNITKIRRIFSPPYAIYGIDEFEHVFVYTRIKERGRWIYLPLNSSEIQNAYEQVRDGDTDMMQNLFVQKTAAHRHALGYSIQEYLPEDSMNSLYRLTRRTRTQTAEAAYQLLRDDGYIEPMDFTGFKGHLNMRLDLSPATSHLLFGAQDFYTNFPELRHLDEELADLMAREKWEESEAKEIMDYDERRLEIEAKSVQVLERLGVETVLLDTRENAAKALLEKLSLTVSSGTASPGRVRKVQLSQPGTFEFQRTFNQGSFISVQEILDPEAEKSEAIAKGA